MADDRRPADFIGTEHVQLIIPEGQERRAREFYVDLLGFTEIVRPESLGGRGGGWFRNGGVNLHLGSVRDFHATQPGHPAWLGGSRVRGVAVANGLGSQKHPEAVAHPAPAHPRTRRSQ